MFQMALMMEKTVSTLEVGREQYSSSNSEKSCDNCGTNFKKPLFATIYSGEALKEYYACPRCLSKIIDVNIQKKDKIKQLNFPKTEGAKPKTPKVENPKESIPGCKNTIGFLKRKPKDTPIPEECFICNKMIDCMAY